MDGTAGGVARTKVDCFKYQTNQDLKALWPTDHYLLLRRLTKRIRIPQLKRRSVAKWKCISQPNLGAKST